MTRVKARVHAIAVAIAASLSSCNGAAGTGPCAALLGAARDPGRPPSIPLVACIEGVPLHKASVVVAVLEGAVRMEVLDLAPGRPCAAAPDAQGFSVKMPGEPAPGTVFMKPRPGHPGGWSAFTVTRGGKGSGGKAGGSAVSDLASDWSVVVEIDELDAATREIAGRMLLVVGDGATGAAGSFSGHFCPAGS